MIKRDGHISDDDMPNVLLTNRQLCKHLYSRVKEAGYYNDVKYLENLLDCLNRSIGVDGSILAPFIGSEIEAINEKRTYRNRKSQRLFVRWLLSEVRDYLEFGTYNGYINVICKRKFSARLERLKTDVKEET